MIAVEGTNRMTNTIVAVLGSKVSSSLGQTEPGAKQPREAALAMVWYIWLERGEDRRGKESSRAPMKARVKDARATKPTCLEEEVSNSLRTQNRTLYVIAYRTPSLSASNLTLVKYAVK